MLQATCIGYIGSDAEVKVSDGHEFTTFRIAHSDIVPSRLVDSNGVLHNVTKWFYVQELVRTKKDAEFIQLFAERSMQPFNVDRQGFVYPVTNEQKQDDTNGKDEPF